MKKLSAFIILAAIAGLISFQANAAHTHGHGGFGYGYGFGYGAFGGFGHGYGFGHEMTYGMGYGFGMIPGGYMNSFANFGGMDFTAYGAVSDLGRKIVPMLPTAKAADSITYDENGEIHVRPFDDEDLFAED